MQLLKNTGFEEGMPNNWQTYTNGVSHRYIYPETGRIGGLSVAIEYLVIETGKIAVLNQTVQIDNTKKYKLSGWLKTQNIVGKGASIKVNWKDSNKKIISSSTIMARKTGTIPWTYFEGGVAPHQNAVSATIVLELYDCSGKVWFDDISFSMIQSPVLSHPSMFLNQTEIDNIKSRLDKEPWKEAYGKFITTDIPDALNTPIQSVTFGKKIPPSNDKHDYWTDSPYCGWATCTPKPSGVGNKCCDGFVNPNADRTDYNAAMKLRDAVRTLGLAYVLTDDRTKESQYANKAIQLINGWCINPETKMSPRHTNEQSKVELGITMSGMFYGADLIWDYSGWDIGEKNRFVEWVRDFVGDMKTWAGQYDNNYELVRLIVCASGSVITGDNATLQDTFNRYKTNIVTQVSTSGVTVKETSRTRSFTYCHLTAQEFLHIAEIAKHHGVDLYNYKAPTGQSIELILDWLAQYATHKKTWPYKEVSWSTTYQVYSLYELAYKFKQKLSYKDAINYVNPSLGINGRPLYDIRDLGPTTLTHGLFFRNENI